MSTVAVGIRYLLFACEGTCGHMCCQKALNMKQQLVPFCEIYEMFSPSASHAFEPFGKGKVLKFLQLLLSLSPNPQLTLADRPHICALYKNSWLREQVQVNQTQHSSAIKHCCETDNPADRQPGSIR